jgi:hypothetical protein
MKGGESTMTFRITIKDDFFNKELTGTFVADSEEAALVEAKDHYAYELDTNIEEIQILKVEEAGE